MNTEGSRRPSAELIRVIVCVVFSMTHANHWPLHLAVSQCLRAENDDHVVVVTVRLPDWRATQPKTNSHGSSRGFVNQWGKNSSPLGRGDE